MRGKTELGVLAVCALTLAACGNSADGNGNGNGTGNGASAASQPPATTSVAPPPIVSPGALDVGLYPTVPRAPLGTAGSPAAGATADAQHMADFVIGPWDVDEKMVEPYLSTFYVLDTVTTLQQLGPESVATAAGNNGFVNGFASARQITDKAAMVNAVLRFANPAAAIAASAAMGDASAKQPIKGIMPTVVPIPGHPTAVASTYPFTPAGSTQSRATVRSFTPHGPYVLMQFAQTVDGLDAATGLIGKAIDAQGPAIDQFKPADPAAFAQVPLDPTGLLARTLPVLTATESKNAVYGPRGAMHFQSNPPASLDLFKSTGTTEVAMGQTNVYEAKDFAGAAAIIDTFKREVSTEGTQPADPVRALPQSQCLAFPQQFYCVAPAGRYAIEARSEKLLDTQQLLAAQYVLLTAK